jgi:hypothetical protein
MDFEPRSDLLNKEDLLKAQDNHIPLTTESEGEMDESASDTNSSHGTPERPSRGRKPEKKKREEQSYRDVVQGSQHTIPEMISTRSTRKQGRALKGATNPQNGK